MSHKEAVMISIGPKWCEEIFVSKNKNIELRKSKPKNIPLPFKAYVYCSADKGKVIDVIHKGETIWNPDDVWEQDTPLFIKIPTAPAHMLGKTKKVIGEMLIDRFVIISRMNGKSMINGKELSKDDKLFTCVTVKEFDKYRGEKEFLYGWHIAETKLYIQPRELSLWGLSKPPQSWQYLTVSDQWDRSGV